MALGHPIGATGSILVNTIVDELERRDAQFGSSYNVCCRWNGTSNNY